MAKQEWSDQLGQPNALTQWAKDDKPPFGVGETTEVANWIGRVIVGYSAAEFDFYMIYAILNPENAKISYAEFYSKRSINNKENLLLQHRQKLPVELLLGFDRLLRRLRGAATKRAEIAHCVLLNADSRLISIRLQGKRAYFVTLNKTYFSKAISIYRTLQADAHTFQVFLRLIDPDTWDQRISELPLPQYARRDDSEDQYLGPLPPHVEAERIDSLKRLGLEKVIVLEQSPYRRFHANSFSPTRQHTIRYRDQLVLMLP